MSGKNLIQRTRKLLKRYLWLFLAVLGLVSLSVVFWVKGNPSAVSLNPLPSVPAPSSSPSVKATPAAPTVQVTPPHSMNSPRSSVPIGSDGKPLLTPEQEAMNRKAKAAFQAASASVDSFIEIHVALAEGVSSLGIGASEGADLLDQQGHPLGQLSAKALYTVTPGTDAMTLGTQQLPGIVWVEASPTGVLYVGNGTRSYRGRLLLVSHAGALWAVNYVDLRRYLYSVVGSEVSPSWPMAALKAQAIAARSYALVYYFRPASSLYHLGSTESYQVYSGIEREADTVRQAVDATAGEFVSYRGGIVESLYAASDDIVAEAFHGHGMSQLGAYDFAQRGYSDRQILGHYYPNTGVARFELDQE